MKQLKLNPYMIVRDYLKRKKIILNESGSTTITTPGGVMVDRPQGGKK